LLHGKTVLFVAEKRAALDVVLNRLNELDLGHLCLDLHGPTFRAVSSHVSFRRASPCS
jgi:hypothetical protein